MRWLGFIPELSVDIVYVKGEENCVAEALSIRLHATHVATVNSYRIRSCGLKKGNDNQAEVSRYVAAGAYESIGTGPGISKATICSGVGGSNCLTRSLFQQELESALSKG